MSTDVKQKSSKIIIEEIKSETFNRDVGSANSFFRNRYMDPSDLEDSTKTCPNSSNVSQIANDIKILRRLEKPDNNLSLTNISKDFSTQIYEEKSTPIIMLDHSLTKVFITKSTFKYGLILLITLGLISFLMFIFVIGAINVNECPLSPNIPLYLLVMGLMGILRIVLFYSCPFSYSKSVGAKIYENVFKSLIIDRVKVSNKASKAYAHSQPYATDDTCLSKLSVNSSRFFSFVFNFCCCCCCFNCIYFDKNCGTWPVTCKKRKITKTETPNEVIDSGEQLDSYTISQPPVVFQISQAQSSSSITNALYLSKCESQNFEAHISKSKSFSSMSTKTNSSNLSTLFNGLLPFNTRCWPQISSRKCTNSLSSRVSFTSFKAKEKYYKKQQKIKKLNSSKYSVPKAKYIYTKRAHNQRHSRRHTSYHYTSHKRIKHHYKQQRPYRLIDFRSIRYGTIHFIQRCIDVFIIIWFICGNYWVLVVFDQDSHQVLPKKLNVSEVTKHEENVIVSNLNETTQLGSIECDTFCYRTAFSQIILSYSVFMLFVVFVITFRIYLITCGQKRVSSRKRRGSKVRKKY